jgi:HK97 family phage major capsid protein
MPPEQESLSPYAELVSRLRETRAGLASKMKETFETARQESRKLNKGEQAVWDAADLEIRELDEQIEKFTDADERETRAANLRAKTRDTGAEGGQAGPRESRATITSEPQVYGRGTGHSYLLDMARVDLNRGDGDGGVAEARVRQERHRQELSVELPARHEARKRAADRAWEAMASGERERDSRVSRAERRALERFANSGIKPFERRFISRVDGQGGYFVPPLWLIDEYVPYLRVGRVFADQWMGLPLPSGTDSINIPRVVLGTATGPQVSDGAAVPGRDMQDNFVNALVRTVAGQQDAAIQLLDQSPIAFDQVIFKDLMADYAMNLSGQLIVGSGSNGQLTGVYSAGTLGTSSGKSTSGFVVSDSATAWTAAAGTANFYAGMAKIVSQIARNRFRPPTHIITNPAVWYGLSSAMDTTNRPLVVPQQQGTSFNAAAGDDDGPVAEGPVGHILGIPWLLDPNIPLTFGGTGAPSIGSTSSGNVAPVAGTGTNAVQTPGVAGVFDDLYLWEGELRSRTLSEVLSGNLQVRFQVYAYVADMPNRYQDSSGNLLSYGNYNSLGAATTGILASGGGLTGF